MLFHCADGQKAHLVKAEPFEPLNLDLDRTNAHPEAKEGVRRLIISPAECICKIFTLKATRSSAILRNIPRDRDVGSLGEVQLGG